MKRLSWLLGVALLSGCSWMPFVGDDSGSDDGSEIEPAELVDFDEEVKIRKLWSTGLVGDTDWIGGSLRPALGGGAVYAADSDGNVAAVDASTGKERWEVELETRLSGGVGYGAGLVMVGGVDGDVYALDADNGALKWRAFVSSEVLSAPVSNGEVVVVQSQDGRVVGLDAATGEEIWRFELDLPVLTVRGTSGPLITDTMVMLSFANGKVYGLSSSQGTMLWESRVAVPQGRTELERMVDIDGQPLLVGDIIYAVSYQGRLGAMSRGSGRSLWYQNSSSHRSPAYGLEQVYVAESDDTLRAFRASSGQVLWSNDQLLHRQLGTPIVAAGYLAVADEDGYLHLMSQVDGHFVGRTKVDGSGVASAMVTDNDVLYVQDKDGDITAYSFD